MKSWTKHALAGVLVMGGLGGSVVVGSAPALAAPPVNGCPSGPNEQSGHISWSLFAPIGEDAKFDKNGDGLICVRSVGQPGQTVADPSAPGNSITTIFDLGATVKDNNSGPKS